MKPKYLAEGGEAVEFSDDVPMDFGIGDVDFLSDSMAAVEGPSHESASGGVPMAGGDRVYSDSLKPTPEVSDYLRKLRIKGDTYADLAKSLGRLESKYAEKLESFDSVEKRTGEEMMNRINEAKEILFSDQEYQKAPQAPDPNDMQMMRYGGNTNPLDRATKKMALGGFVPFAQNAAKSAMRAVKMWEPKGMLPMESIKPLSAIQTAFKMNDIMNPEVIQEQQFESPSGFDRVMSTASGMLPDAANLLGFMQRNKAINRMPLTQEQYPTYRPVLQDVPFDNQNEIQSIRATTNTAGRGLGFINPTVAAGVKGDMLSRSVSGINSSFDNKRRMERFAESQNMWQANQASQFGAQQANSRFADLQQNTWSRQVERTNNWDAAVRGIIGNAEQRRLASLDRDRMNMIGKMDGDRGTSQRLYIEMLKDPNLSPEMRKTIEGLLSK